MKINTVPNASNSHHVALRGMGGGLAAPREHIDALVRYWSVVGDLVD